MEVEEVSAPPSVQTDTGAPRPGETATSLAEALHGLDQSAAGASSGAAVAAGTSPDAAAASAGGAPSQQLSASQLQKRVLR